MTTLTARHDDPVGAATDTEVTGRVSVTTSGGQVPTETVGPTLVDATGRLTLTAAPLSVQVFRLR